VAHQLLWREPHRTTQVEGRVTFPWTKLVARKREGLFYPYLVMVRHNTEVAHMSGVRAACLLFGENKIF
jgi:hypothetical protein